MDIMGVESKLKSLKRSFKYEYDDINSIWTGFIIPIQKQYIEALKDSKFTMIPSLNNDSFIERSKYDPSRPKKNNFYLVLDFGGTSLKIAYVNNTGLIVQQKNHKIEITEVDEKFFNWISLCIFEFLNEFQISGNTLTTAITWSFPISQTSLNDGDVKSTFGKGYTINLENEYFKKTKSIKSILEYNFKTNFNLNLNIVSVINDSIANMLLSDWYYKEKTCLAIIVGTGTNACIKLNSQKMCQLSKKSRLEKYDLLNNNDGVNGNLYVNTELSFFGLLPFLEENFVSKYDLKIHKSFQRNSFFSVKPYLNDSEVFQPLEYITSGRYTSELIRLVLVDLIEDKDINLVGLAETNNLLKPFGKFNGEAVCFISNNSDKDLIRDGLFQTFNIRVENEVITVMKQIIKIVINRAAVFLTATIISLVIFQKKFNDEELNSHEDVVITFESSFLKNFNYYFDRVIYYFEILDIEHNYIVKFLNNSSLSGSGIAAYSITA